jgi:hypothetical protein
VNGGVATIETAALASRYFTKKAVYGPPPPASA